VTLIAVVALALALAAFALAVGAKHRSTWAEIFRLRRELAALHDEVVAAREESAIATIGDASRLPLRMPSQNGEDLLLWNFFGRKRSGFYVDVGAYDGIGFSNSYFFEAIGWSGVLVEAAPELYRAAVAARPHSRVVHAAAGSRGGTVRFTVAEGGGGVGTLSSATPDLSRIAREGGRTREVEVPLMTLDEILKDVHQPIDFVSIDVEGGELAALEGFDLQRFAPRALVIEDNSGGADRRVADHLAQRGYVERFRVEQNAFYTRRDDERGLGWRA
jgi:FkbM family methyltransferase